MLQELECYNQNARCIIKDINKDKIIKLDEHWCESLEKDLPAVRLQKINTKFEKHLNSKFKNLISQIKEYLEKDE